MSVRDDADFEFTFEVDGEQVIALEKNTFNVEPSSNDYAIARCQGKKCEDRKTERNADGQVIAVVPKKDNRFTPKICVVLNERLFGCQEIQVARAAQVNIDQVDSDELLTSFKDQCLEKPKECKKKVTQQCENPDTSDVEDLCRAVK